MPSFVRRARTHTCVSKTEHGNSLQISFYLCSFYKTKAWTCRTHNIAVRAAFSLTPAFLCVLASAIYVQSLGIFHIKCVQPPATWSQYIWVCDCVCVCVCVCVSFLKFTNWLQFKCFTYLWVAVAIRMREREREIPTVHEDSNKGTERKKTTKNSLHADCRRKMRKINIMCMDQAKVLAAVKYHPQLNDIFFFRFSRRPLVLMTADAHTAFTVPAHAHGTWTETARNGIRNHGERDEEKNEEKCERIVCDKYVVCGARNNRAIASAL